MNAREPADDGVVTDGDVPGQTRRIRQDQMIAQMAIVGDMHIGHQKIRMTHGGDAPALHGRPIDRHILAQDIVVTDHDFGRLPLVLPMLRRPTHRDKGMQFAPLSDVGPAINTHMRQHSSACADPNVFADDRVGPYLHVVREYRLRMDHRGRMDLHSHLLTL